MSVTYSQEGAVGYITLNRPESFNAINGAMAGELLEVLGRAAAGASSVVITGAGKAFSSGADLADLLNDYSEGGPDLDRIIGERFNPIIETLANLPIPTVAAVNGACAGAGMGIALACDLRVLSDNAFFMSAFVRVGLVPDSGTTWFLPAMVGVSRASEIAMSGRRVPAAEALDLGLTHRVTGSDLLLKEATELARTLAAGPTDALVETRVLLRGEGLSRALGAERLAQGRLGKRHDHLEGAQAFVDKRIPDFTDRREIS